MDKRILGIYSLLQEISWQFGERGINGECCGDLSLADFMALKNVYENSKISIQDVGNSINFTKSGATRIINRLESKGYVTRESSPIDGRICCVSVTEKGAGVITEIIDKYTIYLEKVLSELDTQKVEDIEATLEVLLNAIRKSKPVNSTTITL